MKSYTTIIAAAAMLQGAMAQGAEEKPQLGPNLDASDIARQVNDFANACRQDSVGQVIDGKTVPFPCNAEVQIKSRCDQMAKNVEEMKECLCRKNADKQPSAFFEVAQACVSCNRCNRLVNIEGAEYFSGLFNDVEDKFCSPENTETYEAIYTALDKAKGGMPASDNFQVENTCQGKPPNILDYAKPEIQPWDAGGRFAKGAKAPGAPAGNNSTNGTAGDSKGTDEKPFALKPVPVADQVCEVCATVLEKSPAAADGVYPKYSNDTASQGVKYSDVCMPLVQKDCTVDEAGLTCSEAMLRPDLANRTPSELSTKWSFNITFTDKITSGMIQDCEPLPQPAEVKGNVIQGSKMVASDSLAESIMRNTLPVNIQNNIQINNIFQQCGICEEAAKKVKEEPEQPKTGPAPLTPNKQTGAQPEEEDDVSCEVEDEPAGGQGGSQPTVTNNINLENKINIESGGASAGSSGPGSDGTTPNPPSKGTAPGPEASEGETPKKPMPSGVTPPGTPGNGGVAPSASQGNPGVSVSTETTTSSRNGTATTPSCKGPSCAPVLVNGAGAFRASVMAAAAAVLVAAL